MFLNPLNDFTFISIYFVLIWLFFRMRWQRIATDNGVKQKRKQKHNKTNCVWKTLASVPNADDDDTGRKKKQTDKNLQYIEDDRQKAHRENTTDSATLCVLPLQMRIRTTRRSEQQQTKRSDSFAYCFSFASSIIVPYLFGNVIIVYIVWRLNVMLMPGFTNNH